MIERIQIQNFQRHARLRISFDEKITTIVGPSDTGKSALLRAIRWVAFNRPLGGGFIRHGEKFCSVKLWVDGRKVERRKTGGENAYYVDGRRLAAVGTDVPEQVRNLLNVSADNFQGQHDPLYWFSLTPGEVAKRLNSVVDLEIIDRSASWISGRLRKSRAEQGVVEDRLAVARAEAASLEFVADLSAEYESLKKAADRWQDAVASASACQEAVENAVLSAQEVTRCVQTFDEAWTALRAAEAVRVAVRRSRELSLLVGDIALLEDRISSEVPDLGELSSAYESASSAAGRRDGLAELLGRASTSLAGCKAAGLRWRDAAEDLWKQIEGACPLCGRVFEDGDDCDTLL